MNVLFVHNNFPAQYRHVATALLRDPEIRICAVSAAASRGLKGVRSVKYNLDGVDVAATHPFARRFDLESRRAEQVLYALSSLTATGFTPDVIMAHPGWGETLPLRALFPRARFVLYCEFFYGVTNRDVGFDPEFAETGADGHVALHAEECHDAPRSCRLRRRRVANTMAAAQHSRTNSSARSASFTKASTSIL